MAKIEFDAFVEDALTGDSGTWALKTAEPHSRKDENGKWQTVARTFRTVKVSRESGVSLSGIAKGDRVRVHGAEKTEAREYEGKKYYDLIVWADRVEPLERSQGGQSGPQTPNAGAGDPWATPGAPAASGGVAGGGGYDDDTPF